MNANTNLRESEEAVSPVIGVILMVAITVVLAAVVFVLVSNLGGDSESAPNISFTKDETADRLKVADADSDANWNRIAVKAQNATLGTADFCWAESADATGCTIATDGETEGPDRSVGAADYIDLCTTDASAARSVTVEVLDTAANSVVATFTFSEIQVC